MWVWDSCQFGTQGTGVLRDVEKEMKEIYGEFNGQQLLRFSVDFEEVIPQLDPNATSEFTCSYLNLEVGVW